MRHNRILWGPGYIEEQLQGRRFRISTESFFQTNTEAAEALYGAVIRLAEFSGQETVWDLYCGAGSIALSLADQVRRVVGFELVEAAVQDAYVNSRAQPRGQLPVSGRRSERAVSGRP